MPEAAAPSSRSDRLDALRGAAIVWMAAFHFSFDLNHFGWIRQDFYRDPVWTWQRVCIVSLFLFCAGGGQAFAVLGGQGSGRFWKRWGQVAGCAVLVSLGSWVMFPGSWISFGVLHGIALMLLMLRLGLARLPNVALLGLAALAIAAPRFVQLPFFDTRWANWVGLVTHKPITEDYVPVLPWLGVMWWGLAGTKWMLAHRRPWLSWALPGQGAQPLVSGDNAGLARVLLAVRQGLAMLGRWSLTF